MPAIRTLAEVLACDASRHDAKSLAIRVERCELRSGTAKGGWPWRGSVKIEPGSSRLKKTQ